MNDVGPTLDRYLPWLLAGAAALVATILSARAVARILRGEAILRPDLSDAVFVETWMSAGRVVPLWSRGCTWVAVTSKAIHVGLHFPFNLILPRTVSRWLLHDLQIPFSRVRLAQTRPERLYGPSLELKFRDEHGEKASIRLRLKSLDAFIRHFDAARRRPRSAS